jgi:hypothetical protein
VSQTLDDILAKLARAREHILAADEEVRAFVDNKDRSSVENLALDDGSDASRAFAREHADREVPKHLRIVAGEAVHQLRTLLDHLVHCLIVANNGKPNGRNGFPIYEVEPKGRGQKRFNNLIAGVHPDVRSFILELQPYTTQEPSAHGLALLRMLNDADKHETILLTVARVVPMTLVSIPGGYMLTQAEDSFGSAFAATPGASVSRRLQRQVVFPVFGGHEDIPVYNGLMGLYSYVETHVVREAKSRFFNP